MRLARGYLLISITGSVSSSGIRKVQRADFTCHVIRNSLRLCCDDQSGTIIQILLEPRDTFFMKLRLYQLQLIPHPLQEAIPKAPTEPTQVAQPLPRLNNPEATIYHTMFIMEPRVICAQ